MIVTTHELTMLAGEIDENTGRHLVELLRNPRGYRWPLFTWYESYPGYAWSRAGWDAYRPPSARTRTRRTPLGTHHCERRPLMDWDAVRKFYLKTRSLQGGRGALRSVAEHRENARPARSMGARRGSGFTVEVRKRQHSGFK